MTRRGPQLIKVLRPLSAIVYLQNNGIDLLVVPGRTCLQCPFPLEDVEHSIPYGLTTVRKHACIHYVNYIQ